ncbi:MAG: type I DNA topoisomerase [Rhodobacteraceae bacterium]|nr:type I DNA topoisomerase [Paracoccaceae bacterium]MCY4249350.1 type I DNA topoisomerase [Paracoccaceae bacterium]MCY4308073.1 type I DNA topoisomerase [Paracoccaceae bacterium]
MPIVVVESPAKARTIEKYLGKDFKVLASYGHVRDFKPKYEAVDPKNNFKVIWQVPTNARKRINAIISALESDPNLILATDPDREGEAISWHLEEILKTKFRDIATGRKNRISFTSITKDSVQSALKEPRQIDMDLVDAYLARRTMDFLVGFNLSPILWKKLPCGASAGRVQSVCLRLVSEREQKIEQFESLNYWTISAAFKNSKNQQFKANLVLYDGKKLGKFGFESAEAASNAEQSLKELKHYEIRSIISKDSALNPPPPFTTATLQQEANRKLRLKSKETMRVAQKLYESGHITYMRTDAINMAPEAVKDCRHAIDALFGTNYLSTNQRVYKNKAKNAQEAHECIRPTRLSQNARNLNAQGASLTQLEANLYDLIWKRTIATQMASNLVKNTKVLIKSENPGLELSASGKVQLFDGFKKVYEESRGEAAKASDKDESFDNPDLPPLSEGETINLAKTSVTESSTQPPARFSEASLVKAMVDHGIGRPSTYSSTIATLIDRGYVIPVPRSSKLQPTPSGRVVVAFLQKYFPKYMEYGFTADMEDLLDEVSGGRANKDAFLSNFWTDFAPKVDNVTNLDIKEVIENVAEVVAPQILANGSSTKHILTCPNPHCKGGKLELRVFKNTDPYFSCSKCKYNQPFLYGKKGSIPHSEVMGKDPETGKNIILKSGRFGNFFEIHEEPGSKSKPKRAGIPESFKEGDYNLDLALKLFSLPRLVGSHPETGKEIIAGIGPLGPYLKHDGKYKNLDKENPNEVFEIGINRAVSLLNDTTGSGHGILGVHPDGGNISLLDGRYGPYLKWNNINASLPKSVKQDSLTIENAIEIVNNKANRSKVINLGEHPQKKGPVELRAGRYGPYVSWNKVNATLPKDISPKNVNLELAVQLINKKIRG